ncbi:MAG TPA: DUF2087 domain-containing protein [Candidatus Saccharimonadales bacterium]|nr:DUF2087 domain-containing protein [Candidatus Saccharimonadales bacterium]
MALASNDISKYLDSRGRVTKLPKKVEPRQAVLSHLASKFEHDKTYRESEVDKILQEWHTFGDWPLLRRELYEHGFFERRPDGSEYQRKK